MSQNPARHEITLKPLVYTMRGVDAVTIRRDETWRRTGEDALAMDLYYPPASTTGVRFPAVVFAIGFPDPGARRMLGCAAKDMESYGGWARLVAASGMVAVTYTNRDPAGDLHAVLRHVCRHAESSAIDERRIGIWACSGHAPVALSALMHDAAVRPSCAALLYGYLLDVDGGTSVADAAAALKFANPCAGRSIADLSGEIPLFIVRCGQDRTAGLNDALDRFVGRALDANLPVTVVNHASAPHAFDLFDDSDTSREIIRQVLAFLRCHLVEREADDDGQG